MKFYQKIWFMVVTLIFLPPVGIFVMWKYHGGNKILKGIVTVPLAFYALAFVVALVSPKTATPPVAPVVAPPAMVSSSSTSSTPVPSSKPEISKSVEPSNNVAPSSSSAVESSKPTAPVVAPPVVTSSSSVSSEPIEQPKSAAPSSSSTASVAPTPSESSALPAVSSTPPEKEPEQNVKTVYYTKSGKKYHYANPCGKGTYYPCTLDEAVNKKHLEPCEKCVG